MNKFLKIFNISIIPIILFFISAYLSDLKSIDLILASITAVVCLISVYICGVNEQFKSKEDMLTKEIEEKKNEIKNLKDKISQASMYGNGNTPYIMQLFLKRHYDYNLKKDQWNEIEMIVSTIEKNYDISYINISFDSNVKVEQDNIRITDNAYKLLNTFAGNRMGRKEYNFRINDSFLDRTTAKCIFKVKCETVGKKNLIVEVVGKNTLIKRIYEMEINIVD